MSWKKPTAEPIDGKIQNAVVLAAGILSVFALGVAVYVIVSRLIALI